MAEAVPFDRVAACYDASRGGEARGAHQVAAFLPWMGDGPVVELGVGSGIVAGALAAGGRAPWAGVDLSLPMLARAAKRVPGRVVQGDVLAPPVRPGSAGSVVAVHVFHLVTDLDAAVRAAVRLLRPGGRLLVSGIAGNRQSSDDMSALDKPLSERYQFPPPPVERLSSVAAAHGARLVHDGYMERRTFGETPAGAADRIEGRAWSWLWELPDDAWQADVVPVIEAMRALPDQTRPRPRWMEWHYVVLEAT